MAGPRIFLAPPPRYSKLTPRVTFGFGGSGRTGARRRRLAGWPQQALVTCVSINRPIDRAAQHAFENGRGAGYGHHHDGRLPVPFK